MVAANLALVGWRLRRFGRSLDWAMILALGLVAFNVAFYFSTVAPAVSQASTLRAEVAMLRASIASRPQETAPVHDPVADLGAFYAALARPGQIPDLLRRLHRSADDQGLVVEQGEYRPAPDPDGRLVRYQILLPARGTYPQLRRFLAQASRTLPALALEGVAFQRQQIGDEVLEAQIKFTLFVDAGAADPGGSQR
jgi:hypothetical protein